MMKESTRTLASVDMEKHSAIEMSVPLLPIENEA
jgi:hypothetical protein